MFRAPVPRALFTRIRSGTIASLLATPRRARVALISTYYSPVIGGAELSAARLAGYLRRRAHDLVVITNRTSPTTPEHDVVDGIEVWRLPPIRARSPVGKWLWLPWALAGLRTRRRSFDAIVVVDQRATGVAALAAARLFRKALVIQPQTTGTLDGRHPGKSGPSAILNRVVTWPLRRCYVQADLIACIARSIEAEAREMGVDDTRIAYVPNPVDVRLFAPLAESERAAVRASLSLESGQIVFAFTGRLSREKGIRELLQAWSAAALVNARLLVIGPDMPGHPWDEGPWIREYLRAKGLEASVQLLGPRPHPELARFMGAADVAVLPSHFEAQGLAAVEAMACGRPLVATNVGGVPDFVADGVNGLLVPPKDVAALAAALTRIAGDEPARLRMGLAARETALRFAEDRVLEAFAERIDRLTERTRG